jgi:hypothetical protein
MHESSLTQHQEAESASPISQVQSDSSKIEPAIPRGLWKKTFRNHPARLRRPSAQALRICVFLSVVRGKTETRTTVTTIEEENKKNQLK